MYISGIIMRHVSEILPGDTVLRDGLFRTVSGNNIKRCGFMGTTIWGDSYHIGRLPVYCLDLRR